MTTTKLSLLPPTRRCCREGREQSGRSQSNRNLSAQTFTKSQSCVPSYVCAIFSKRCLIVVPKQRNEVQDLLQLCEVSHGVSPMWWMKSGSTLLKMEPSTCLCLMKSHQSLPPNTKGVAVDVLCNLTKAFSVGMHVGHSNHLF